MSSQNSPQATSSKPAKTAHYTSALSSALLRGAWADAHAGKDAKGYDVSWVELVRKWGKHTGGNTALIHHLRDISLLYLSSHSSSHPSSSGYITITTPQPHQPHARDPSSPQHPADAALHSSSSSAEAGSSQSGSGSSFIHVPHPHLRRSRSKPSLDVSRTGANAASSVGGSTVRGAAAFLSPADLDGDEPEDDRYWAEGSSWWNGVGVDQVEELKEGIRAFESGISSGKLRAGEIQSSKLLLSYHYHAIGEHEKALRTLDSVDWLSNPKVGMNLGEAAVLERIRGRCLQGMSTELLHPSSSSTALHQAYLETIPLITSIFPSPSPAYLSSSPSASAAHRIPFEPSREAHRWISTSLCRSAILSSRQPNALTQTLRIIRTYHAYASSWPTSFRPNQRRRMLLLYLTALGTAYPPSHVSAESPYLLFSSDTPLSARAVWRKEVMQAIREGQQLLSQTTSFPRAGIPNIPVRKFTDLCVALADRSPSLTIPVIEVLWWSMTLTFQNQSVLRHLTRLLHRKGMDPDAKRTFELYVKLVLKSRETAHPESSIQLEDRPTDDPSSSPVQPSQEVKPTADREEREEGVKEGQEEAEIDGDELFVKALLVGVRVLSRELGEMEQGWRYACLAREVIRKAEGGRVRQAVKAEVEEVLGIVRMAMASTGADPITRPTYQAQSINHLLEATKLSPTSASTFFHLAYAQAEARAIDDAIQSIRTSLELDSENVQAWHLLSLLLTARQDWEGARKACEAGIAVWETDEQATASEEDDEEGSTGAAIEGVETRDFALPTSTSQPMSSIPPSSHPLLLPTGQTLPLPPAARATIPRSRKLHDVIRLRMTLNIITEKTSGPELAMLRQQELFAFFSARSGEGRKRFGYAAGAGRGGLGSMPSVGSVGGLGGSYVSIAGTGGQGSVVNVQPPTPAVNQGYTLDPPPQITHSSASSPGNTTPEGDHSEDDAGMETLARDFAEKGSIKEKEKEGRKSLTLGSRKGLAKHLHVPGVKGVGKGRPSSVRRLTGGASGSEGDLASRNRTASASSAALSMAPTAVHSHYHGTSPAHSTAPPLAPPLTGAIPTHGRTPGESRMLSNLWLMSAATFRRWGKPDQCLVAINEAELLDPENAEVWIQLGLYHSSSSSSISSSSSSADPEKALSAYTKAILLRPSHPSGLTHLARLYLSTGQVELAHSILNQVTQDNGWDTPEAWMALARACKLQGRDMRERECLIYALGLEETRPARGLREAVDRWL